MKKRLRKKSEKESEKARREEMHKLLDLVLDINGLSSRKKDATVDLPTAFFEFHGHTSGVDIEVFKNGWDYGLCCNFYGNAYADRLGKRGIHSLLCEAREYAAKEGLLK